MELYTDKPITNIKEDRLNRGDLSRQIANYLIKDYNNENIVISINGKWGSGKTSLINMIKQNIGIICSEENILHPMIIDYCPWNAVSQEKLVSHFLGTLKNGLSVKSYKSLIKAAVIALNVIGIAASFTPISEQAKEVVGKINNQFQKYADSVKGDSSNLDNLKEKVENALKSSPYKYIVFIDDIDRLNNEEIRLLIQLVKSVCNFSNITYVLAFDKNIVSGALRNEQYDVGGDKYLEKIVQIEFPVPEAKHSTIDNLIISDLEKLLADKINESDTHEITAYYSLGLFSQFENIREAKRFINRFAFVLSFYYGKLNLADLLAITYLRCIDESLIPLFREYQEHLFGMVHYQKYEDGETIKNDFKEKISKTRFIDKGKQEYLIGHLFPHMFNYISDASKEYLKGRLCCQEHFHKYLQSELDDDDFELDKIKSILEFKDKNDLVVFSQNLGNGNQGRRLLRLLNLYSERCENKKHFEVMLLFLFSNISEVKFARPFFFVDKDFFIKEISSNAISNIGSESFEKIIEHSLNSYNDPFALTSFLNIINRDEEKKIVVSENIKEKVLGRTKDVILSAISSSPLNLKYKSEYVIAVAIDFFKEELKQLIEEKDDKWISSFISKSILISWVHSDRKHLLFGYDTKRMFELFDKNNLNIDKLINESNDDTEKQHLIVLEMHVDDVKPKNEHGMFYIEEIQEYCNNKGISFTASESYER